MEFTKKCARILRLIFGWLMIVEGGMSGVSVGICTLLTLFGVLETDSFGERLTSFIAGAAATVGFFIIFWLGIRLKNSGSRNMAPALVMQKSSSADQKETQEAANGKVRRKAVSYLDKKEKQEDTAEQCQQCEEEAVFVLYEGHWAGKAENGEDKIFLKVLEDECVITYETLTRNCYATPPKEDVRCDVRLRSLSTISTWSLEDLLLFINRAFHLSISICDCCSEEQYRAWIEQQNTEFYSMEIMVDGTRQECMVRRVNEKSCEEVRFQRQTYFWKESEAIHGLWNYDYAVEVCLNEKVYYLYHTEIPNKNEILYWVVSQITESTFELLKHQPCDHEKIVFGREIGKIGGYEAGRRSTIYKVLALATGRTIGYYQAGDGTRNICLETRGRNMTFEEKIAPIYIPILAGYQMKMHTDSGEAYCFTLTGLKAYDPNMGSRCGYGSDDWCFHCKYNGENYILHFSVDAGSGTYWDCALIHKENAEQLEKLSAVEWLKLVLKSETQIFHLHPDTIDAAKDIVQDTSSRCGSISDNGFYGR